MRLGQAFQAIRAGSALPHPAHLAGFQTQLDLHLTRLGPHPHVDLWYDGRWSQGFPLTDKGVGSLNGQGWQGPHLFAVV